MFALVASVINTAMLAGGTLLVYQGFKALGTRAADDAPLYFIVGTALIIMGAVNAVRLTGVASRVALTKGQDLELKQAAGITTAREPIEPERTSVWFLYPVALLLLSGGLAIVAALWSSPPSRSVDQPWLILAAMRAVFGVGLALAGAILGLAVSRRSVDAIEDARLRAAFPDSPWRWRGDWARGRIRDERGAWLLFGWPLAFIIAGFALQIAATVFARSVDVDLRSVGGIILLAGVPLSLFVALALATARRLKYRRSELVLETLPVVVGAALRGRVEAPIRNYRADPGDQGFLVTLSAVRMQTSGGTTRYKTQSIQKTVLWKAEHHVPASQISRTGNGVTVPIMFSLPRGSLMTNKFDANNRVFWQLDVRAAQPGLDYYEWFDVPVFGASSPS